MVGERPRDGQRSTDMDDRPLTRRDVLWLVVIAAPLGIAVWLWVTLPLAGNELLGAIVLGLAALGVMLVGVRQLR